MSSRKDVAVLRGVALVLLGALLFLRRRTLVANITAHLLSDAPLALFMLLRLGPPAASA